MQNHKIINFLAFSIFIIFSILLAFFAYSFGGEDFNVYYAAARVTLQGGNPYDFQQLAPQIISSAGEINNPYYYAPWFTWLVIPFSLFSYKTARALWLILHFVLWLWGLYNLSKLIAYPQHGWQKWGMWLFATFVFAWSTWGSEQVGILVFFLFTLILLSDQNQNWILLGILLSLILFKPNLTALPVGMILIWLVIQRKQWKPIFVSFGFSLLMILISLWITPNWYVALLNPDKIQGLSYTLDATGTTEIQRYTTTLLDWLEIYGIQGVIASLIYALFAIAGITAMLFSLRRLKSLTEFLAVTLLVNFALIPYALFYDYPSLVIPLFWGNHFLQHRTKLNWFRYIANFSMLAALFIGSSIPYRYWITIFLILFLAIGYFISFRKEKVFIS